MLLVAGIAQAQDPTYFRNVVESEYPNDAYPITVGNDGPIARGEAYLRMGNPQYNWTYWPYPTYYWFDALRGSGVFHGDWPSTAMLYRFTGIVNFTFAEPVDSLRIRLVGDPDIGATHFWVNGEKIDASIFELEAGTEQSACRIYPAQGPSSIRCNVYQAVIASDPTPQVQIYSGENDVSILKISSTSAEAPVVVEPPVIPSDEEDDEVDFSQFTDRRSCKRAGGEWSWRRRVCREDD